MNYKYKEVLQLAQDKGCEFLKCKYCNDIALECLKEGYCAGCYPYEITPTTQWANHKANNLLVLTLIQKWLRDEKLIAVQPKFDSYKPDKPMWYFTVNSLSSKNMGERLVQGFEQYEQYEDALLNGINEALKLLP